MVNSKPETSTFPSSCQCNHCRHHHHYHHHHHHQQTVCDQCVHTSVFPMRKLICRLSTVFHSSVALAGHCRQAVSQSGNAAKSRLMPLRPSAFTLSPALQWRTGLSSTLPSTVTAAVVSRRGRSQFKKKHTHIVYPYLKRSSGAKLTTISDGKNWRRRRRQRLRRRLLRKLLSAAPAAFSSSSFSTNFWCVCCVCVCCFLRLAAGLPEQQKQQSLRG